MDMIYAFWNNKGGTGKTSLAFQAITRYAELNPKKRVFAIDLCPQANLSELMLGGLNNKGSEKLLERQGKVPRCSVGGCRIPSDHIPIRSWPLFLARELMRDLIETLKAEQST